MRIVVVGAGGRLGTALARQFAENHEVRGFTHAELDLGKPENLQTILAPLKFDALVNAAALTNVDYCEEHPSQAMLLNAEAPRILAEICANKHAQFIHISTDYVFDGAKQTPYTEEDEAHPISVYGQSKLEGEQRVLEAYPQATVARVSWIFGPDRPSFIDAILKRAESEEHIAAVSDKFSTPSYTLDLAAMFTLLFRAPILTGGVLHVTNGGSCSWREYAQWALDYCHEIGRPMKARVVDALSLGDMKNFVARRPRHTVLATNKVAELIGRPPRSWREAVAEYVRNYYGP